jgi:hypothetical protein
MKYLKLTLKSLMLFTICISALCFQSCDKDDSPTVDSIDNSAFKAEMRYLWADHASWTRDVILGLVDQTPDANDALARLLENQVDIGNAIKPYYGDAAGQALTDLLTEHIVLAGDILVAARDGDTQGFNTANMAWYQNGDDISVFLNNANPDNWELDPMKAHMKHHLDLTLAEAVAHLEGRHDDEVQAYDDVFEQLMNLADELADGIANQFPDKF